MSGKLAALGLIAVAALLLYEHTLVRHNDQAERGVPHHERRDFGGISTLRR
jgi:hypothetical protein